MLVATRQSRTKGEFLTLEVDNHISMVLVPYLKYRPLNANAKKEYQSYVRHDKCHQLHEYET